MQKIKAVIFDFDGTLADTIPLCITCFRQSVEPIVQRPLSDDEIVAAFGPDELGTIRKFTKENDEEALNHFMKSYTSLHDEYAKLFNGIPDMLKALQTKSLRLALATGKGKDACHFSLHKLGLSSVFEIIETGSPEGSRKKEAIHQILQSFGSVNKSETIYVGDSAGDIKESHAAGIRPIAVAWAANAKKDELEKEKPEKLFHTVASFTEWIEANS